MVVDVTRELARSSTGDRKRILCLYCYDISALVWHSIVAGIQRREARRGGEEEAGVLQKDMAASIASSSGRATPSSPLSVGLACRLR